MQIPASYQIKAIDAYTIEHEPISSGGLMKRAASTVAAWIAEHAPFDASVKVLAGSGNNGGDALVVALLLDKAGFEVECFLFNQTQRLSPDCAFYKEQIDHGTSLHFKEVTNSEFLPEIKSSDWVVDGLFGTGLNRPLEEPFVSLIRHINASGATVISIDIPSGLFGEDNRQNNQEHCIHAAYTLSFQFPKLAFLFAENSKNSRQLAGIAHRVTSAGSREMPNRLHFRNRRRDGPAAENPRPVCPQGHLRSCTNCRRQQRKNGCHGISCQKLYAQRCRTTQRAGTRFGQ